MRWLKSWFCYFDFHNLIKVKVRDYLFDTEEWVEGEVWQCKWCRVYKGRVL